jgi:hypothetical protein
VSLRAQRKPPCWLETFQKGFSLWNFQDLTYLAPLHSLHLAVPQQARDIARGGF